MLWPFTCIRFFISECSMNIVFPHTQRRVNHVDENSLWPWSNQGDEGHRSHDRALAWKLFFIISHDMSQFIRIYENVLGYQVQICSRIVSCEPPGWYRCGNRCLIWSYSESLKTDTWSSQPSKYKYEYSESLKTDAWSNQPCKYKYKYSESLKTDTVGPNQPFTCHAHSTK